MTLSPLIQTRQVGSLRVHAIQAGGQKLDGGAMFGVVPKPLWERRIPADERNRIQLGMRCLLIEHDIGLILIDNGAGNKENAKFHEIYAVENRSTTGSGATLLEDGLAALGYSTNDVALMIDSHLHFDHAGGNTRKVDDRIELTFPKARYVAQKGEYHYATHTNERTAGSYFPHNIVPVAEAGRYDFVEGEAEVARGITLIPTPGHTPHHQGILIDGGNDRAFFLADLAPTTAHVPLPWIMGYDVEPLRTLESRREIYRRAAAENWLLVFEHDALVPWGRLDVTGGTPVIRPE
jgi:glyoxylase-like metal-dependent hydrolase (beta-lactamase superfamily II)